VYPPDTSWECQRCSTCCQDTADHRRRIRLLAKEAQEISARTGIPLEQFVSIILKELYPYEMRKKNGKCHFLVENNCQIYPYRPLVCQFYPFEMVNEKDRVKICFSGKDCGGFGRGKSLEESFFRSLATVALRLLSH